MILVTATFEDSYLFTKWNHGMDEINCLPYLQTKLSALDRNHAKSSAQYSEIYLKSTCRTGLHHEPTGNFEPTGNCP